MKVYSVAFALFFLSILSAQLTPPPPSTTAVGGDLSGTVASATVAKLNGVAASAYPVWVKYSVAAIANGVNGCASANGCWQVGSAAPVVKTAGLTQALPLFTLPANGYVSGARIKTSTACTGTATLTVTLGTTGTVGFYLAGLYDLKAAVSNANITTALPAAVGSDTAASTSVTVGFISTVQTLDAVVAGCGFDAHVLWATLP